MTIKEKFAKFVRVVTIPPIMVLSLFMILFIFKRNIFNNVLDLIISLVCFVLIPVIAYPLQKLFSKSKINAREIQRNLAFILSFLGYLFAVIYGFIIHISRELSAIYYGYFISVLILIFSNKVLNLRASGHACSITGTLLYLIYFTGWPAILPCILLCFLIYWASINLKRHTHKELFLGCITAFISFVLSLLSVSVQFA